MKTFHQFRRTARWFLAVSIALLGTAPSALRAGEPIQFTNGKVLPKAKQGGKLTREFEYSPDRGTAVEGLDMIIPSFNLQSGDPKDEKRRKDNYLEKKNWMILDQGELSEAREDEERFGIRDDSIEKDKEAGDFWFSPKGEESDRGPGSGRAATSGTRAPGQSRPLPPGASRTQRPPAASKPQSDASASRSSALPGSQAQGAHVANELNLKSMFSPERSGATAEGGQSSLSLKDILGGPAIGDNSRSERGSMKGLSGSQSRSALNLDSRLDVRPPAALPAFSPAASSLFDSSSRSSGGNPAFDQRSDSSGFRSGGSFGSSAAENSFLPRSSTFGGNQQQAAPAQDSQRARTSREYFERPKMIGQ